MKFRCSSFSSAKATAATAASTPPLRPSDAAAHRCPSSSSSSSSSTSHSSIVTQSFPPSETSISSSSPSASYSPTEFNMTRCQGLDMLVMAVNYLSGSMVGVPFAQKRVIRRRKPTNRFNNLRILSREEDESMTRVHEEECKEEEHRTGSPPNPKRQKKSMALPRKQHKSTVPHLPQWRRQTRQQLRSA